MAKKKRSHPLEDITVKGVPVLLVAGYAFGWLEPTQRFLLERLPLFIALGVAIVLLMALVLRRRIRHNTAQAIHQRMLDEHVASTDAMTGQEFEKLVARLMQRDGFIDVKIPGGSGDLGADVTAKAPDGSTIVIQCKRYGQHYRASSPDMQKFLGTCFHEHDADQAWFVTTTTFTKPARDLGTRRGVRLIDRSVLAEWMASSITQQTPFTSTS